MPQVTNFKDAAKLIAKVVDGYTKEKAFSMHADLIAETPVCTGYAAASWYVTPNSPKVVNENGEREAVGCQIIYHPRYPDRNQYKSTYHTWYIVNLSGYLGELNDGSSLQADPGWVDDVIRRHTI